LTALDTEDCIALTRLYCPNNPLTALGITTNSLLTIIQADGCQLTEAAVDHILVTLVAHGLSNGTCDLAGGNVPPSAGGLAAKATLEGRGWAVTVTP
jgi:hypothetical protein